MGLVSMSAGRGRGENLVNRLAYAPGLALLAGVLVARGQGPVPDVVLVPTLIAFFAALISRLVVAAVIRPARRTPLLVLATTSPAC